MDRGTLVKALKNPRSAATSLALNLTYRSGTGIDIFERDWDNLIILDACRFDIFARVNEIEGSLEAVRSRGSSTSEFIRENFAGRQFYDTVFVSSNAMVGSRREHIDVYKLVGLWGTDTDDVVERDVDDNTSPRSVPEPEPVVEKTLEMHDEHPDKRLIAHFLPPHTPFLVKGGEKIDESSPYRTFTAVRNGEISTDEIRAVYVENVAYVLSHVERLLEELDGKTVVTADHGELVGEGVPWHVRVLHPRWDWSKRHYFDFGHYGNVHEQALVTVPWLEIETGSRRSIETAEGPAGVEVDESAIEAQLEALGYR